MPKLPARLLSHSLLLRRLAYVISICLLTLATLRLWPHAPLSRFAPSSTAVFSADGQLLRLTLAPDQQYRVWTPLAQMSPTLIEAVQLQEDRWFYWHPGFNPISLLRGAVRTYAHANRQGGSTLTMQLARLAYHLNTRTAGGKLHQVAYAIWLEARYSKHDLLEAYLNLAPYGRNIEGAGAASLIYFGKTAAHLTLAEALTLAVAPQRPNTRLGRAARPDALAASRQRLFKRWQQGHIVGEAERQLLSLSLPMRRIDMLPFAAPHFVDMLLANRPTSPLLATTLDSRLQGVLERQVKHYLAQRGGDGVHNAVALLVDPRDMQVRAWLGSADYFNVAIQGQVNGVLAKRSPGSTLKPFIYALAMDQGILHPHSILKDAPTAFGPFSPENFDGRFAGPIAAQDALVRSRNIPAVWVASQLRSPTLYQFLKSAGITQMKSESHYGLALVLGGGELSMEELVGLYAMLGNGGELKPLRYTQDAPAAPGPRLISPEASFITLDMLSRNPRPDADDSFSPARWPISWKTGTSWGFRDAWAVGAVGPYVMAVWVGNFDGSSNPAFVGIDTAAPLFFRIADALRLADPTLKLVTPPVPAGVRKVNVCSASGDLPNAYCPQTTPTWYIPGKSPIKVSTLHRPVTVDMHSGLPVCPPYDPATTRQEIYEFWPSDMLRLFREAGMPRRMPPAAKHCTQEGNSSDAPRITSPWNQVVYTLRTARPDERIALQATVAADVRALFWFNGNTLIGRTTPQAALPWRPEHDGWQNLRVVDDHGRAAARDIRVEMVQDK